MVWTIDAAYRFEKKIERVVFVSNGRVITGASIDVHPITIDTLPAITVGFSEPMKVIEHLQEMGFRLQGASFNPDSSVITNDNPNSPNYGQIYSNTSLERECPNYG